MVRDGSGDPRGVLRVVKGLSEKSWTCRGTLKKFRDGSRGPSGRSRMGHRTLGEVQDGLGDYRKG